MRAPYGTWRSPITADAITKNIVRVSDILVDPVTSTVYHIESRPSEEGRSIVVNTATGRDVTSGRKWNFRTGVHEYGGASAIVHNGIVYFSYYESNGHGEVYRVKEGDEPEAVTPEGKAHRFAAFAIHPVHTHILVAVLEDHTIDEPAKIVNTLCVINTRTKTVKSIITGADFYGCPKFSPDGTRFAWQQWFHPDMPWEGAEVHIGDIIVDSDLDGFSIKNDIHIAGKSNDISCGYLEWTSNNTVIFTSDVSKFINPWKYSNGKSSPLFPTPIPQEFGSPMWTLNNFPYAILDKENRYALFVAIKDGRDELQLVDLEGGAEPQPIKTPYVVIEGLRSVSKENQEVVFIGGKVDEKECIVKCTILTLGGSPQATFTMIKTETANETTSFPKEIISTPQALTIQGRKGDVHVVFYPPRNPQYAGSNIDGERPPCVVHVHGGPTSLQKQGLQWMVQYFTSRGWAWLTVNYGGSTGYGREYIKRLEGAWGEVDVDDTISAAKSISSAPHILVDSKRMVIRGGSAGGWTVLCALSYGSDRRAFAAGNSLYGVTELTSFVDGTHKFESKYLLKLVGTKGTNSPEDLAIYKQKSPVTHGKDIVVPLLILQGDVDKVVPKQQADEMVKTIVNAHVEYEVYPDEGHGWRQEKNIKAALLREIDFYESVLKLNGKSL